MKYLFRCSVGPVQEFIATARRSRDLQYGSWLLSELAKAGAKAIAEAEGAGSLIFPTPDDKDALNPNTELNVPNVIQAIIETTPPKTLGQKVYQAIRNRLRELAKPVFNEVERKAGNDFKRELAERQIGDMLEFYWVAVPLEGEYKQARHQAAAWLAARKNTRDFEPFKGAMVPKSSLDASRESVIDEKAYDQYSAEDLYRVFGVRRGERLSGVDLLKRLGKPAGKSKFPSTSELAARPFMDGLPQNVRQELIHNLRGWVNGISTEVFKDNDAVLLYPPRIAEVVDNEDAVSLYRRYLADQLKEYGNRKSPGAYYALLLADGDSMGEKLDAQGTEEAHRELSQKLSKFTDEARKIIGGHGGAPIYLGGDDIMAYLPLHTALDCLQELGEAFKGIGTLSGGLVIAHHLEPLSEVLQLARAAEKRAKDVPGKNGLCIVYSKRSGAGRQIVAKWPALRERLGTLAQYHRQGWLSRGAAHELQRMHTTLHELDLPKEQLQDMMEKETLRIIARKRQSGGKEELPEDVRKQLEAWLAQIAVDELALEMIVALEFARAQDLANLPLDEKAKEAAQ